LHHLLRSAAKSPDLLQSRPSSDLVVVVNDRLAPGSVIVILLDDGRAIGGFSLLDYRGAIPIPISVIITMTFADGYASANRTNSHADIVCQRRS
jgi:hypothetical protein